MGQVWTAAEQSVTGLGDPAPSSSSQGQVIIIAPAKNASIRDDTTVIVSAPAGTIGVTVNLTRGDPAPVLAQTVLPVPLFGTTWSRSLAFNPGAFRGYRPFTLSAIARGRGVADLNRGAGNLSVTLADLSHSRLAMGPLTFHVEQLE